MTMKKVADVIAHVRDYARDGKTKRVWAKCGVAFRDSESGAMSIQLDTFPCAPTWSGFLKLVFDDRLKSADFTVRPSPQSEENGQETDR